MQIDFIHRDTLEFLDSLELDTRSQTTKLLELLSERCYELRMPFSKKIQKDLFELRVKSIQNIRIFYTFYQNKIIILHAYKKKAQKLNKADLLTAIGRLKWLH